VERPAHVRSGRVELFAREDEGLASVEEPDVAIAEVEPPAALELRDRRELGRIHPLAGSAAMPLHVVAIEDERPHRADSRDAEDLGDRVAPGCARIEHDDIGPARAPPPKRRARIAAVVGKSCR
jgi:hypothetical protein